VTTSADAAGAVTLARDCSATTVPGGASVALAAGTSVHVVQRLGGSITVRTGFGSLLRVDADDADALGLVGPGRNVTITTTGPFDMDEVTAALRTVYDPEIPVSIVDLGLVYRCDEIVEDDGTRRIEIDMSMTAPGCGMGDILCADARRAVERVAGVDHADVNLVFDPPWGIDRISDEARLELGLF
jgi:probable FeS assembly SUF system protein SufT